MSAYPTISSEIREQILNRIKEKGERASDLAKEYGVKQGTIYTWLKRGATEPSTVLELARVKREQQDLLQIIGELIATQRSMEKKEIAMEINKLTKPESKKLLAENLGISRSSLYYKPKMPAKDLAFKQEIERVMKNNKAYGHKRIAIALNSNKKKVLRVMNLFGLKPLRRRRKPKKIEDIKQKPMPIPNLLKNFLISQKNQVWVSDFTYLPFQGRFVYLATVMDAFTREIIGWEVSTRHNTDLVMKAFISALEKNQIPKIIHSDQGSEYRNNFFINFLKSKKIQVSMSRKASPWENGFQESFYSGFKLDLGHPESYSELGELIAGIAEIIGYYNNSRIHTALKMPPAKFASRFIIKNSLKIPTNLCRISV